jgi:hypothetical protein
LQIDAWLQSLFVPAPVSAIGPAVRAPLQFFSRTHVCRAFVRRTCARFLVLFGGAMVLIRLSVAPPFFSLVFRGQRFSVQSFRGPLVIEDGSRRSVHGPWVRDLWSAAGSVSPFAGFPAMGLRGP